MEEMLFASPRGPSGVQIKAHSAAQALVAAPQLPGQVESHGVAQALDASPQLPGEVPCADKSEFELPPKIQELEPQLVSASTIPPQDQKEKHKIFLKEGESLVTSTTSSARCSGCGAILEIHDLDIPECLRRF